MGDGHFGVPFPESGTPGKAEVHSDLARPR